MIFLKKSQHRVAVFKGEITAFLALLFVLMLSLVAALVESASIQIIKNRKRADTILALESVFAEYNREALEQYDLFVRTEQDGDSLGRRLKYYGATNMTHTITKKELLTDYQGQPFFKQAVSYMKDLLGIDEEISESEYEFDTDSSVETEEFEVMEELEHLLGDAGEQLPEENNPISSIQNLKKANLLTLVVENPESLSNRAITIEELPSNRTLKTGNYGEAQQVDFAERLIFTEYLLRHFHYATETGEPGTLLYELEYLLGGRPSDKENLEQVCKQILYIRMAINYTYLLTDTSKQAEAEAMAFSLCSLLTVPGITGVVKHAILLAWAYGEGIVDVRTLLKGNKVPLLKTAETWQLQLVNLVKLGTSEEVVDENNSPGGWSYQTYLRGLLLVENCENLCMRSLDLIESNLQIRVDECMTKVEIESNVTLRRGVKDRFKTTYEYQ